MDVVGSEGLITASRFRGETPLKVSRSRLDLAGVKIKSEASPVKIGTPSELLFSISEIDSPDFSAPIQGLLQMDEGEQIAPMGQP